MKIRFPALAIEVKENDVLTDNWFEAFPEQGLGLAIAAITNNVWLFRLIKEEKPLEGLWRVSHQAVDCQGVRDGEWGLVRYLEVPKQQLPVETEPWADFAERCNISCVILSTDWIPKPRDPTTIDEQAAINAVQEWDIDEQAAVNAVPASDIDEQAAIDAVREWEMDEQAAIDEVLKLEKYLNAQGSQRFPASLMLNIIKQIEQLPGYLLAMEVTRQIKTYREQLEIEVLDRQTILDQLNMFYEQHHISRPEQQACLKIRQVWEAFLPETLELQAQKICIQDETPHNPDHSKKNKAQKDRAWIVQTEALCHQWVRQAWSCLAWMQRYYPLDLPPIEPLHILLNHTIQGIPNIAQRRYLDMYTFTMMKRIFGNLQTLHEQRNPDQNQEEEPAFSQESASS